MNIHNPQRYEGESREQYHERRAESKAIARKVMGHCLSGGVNSRQQQRDSMRKGGAMGKRLRASDALMAAWASKRVTKAKRRDEHGAYTLVGRKTAFNGETIRRKWLAGISAQRGY